MFEQIAKDDYEEIIYINNKNAGLQAFIVIHDSIPGCAFGGIRIWRYKTEIDALQDGLKLSKAMTYKCALAGIKGGGAKTVVMKTPHLDRPIAMRILGRFIDGLGGRYYAGPDVGITREDIRNIKRETRFIACEELGKATALGVLWGIKGGVNFLFNRDTLKGMVVAIQGLGSVGFELANLLVHSGANVIGTDIDKKAVFNAKRKLGIEIVEPSRIYDTKCDIFSPCAIGGVINKKTIHRLKCRLIAGSANNTLLDEKYAFELHRRDITYLPDYVINAGALIRGAYKAQTGKTMPLEKLKLIYHRIIRILQISSKTSNPPLFIANEMARKFIKKRKYPKLKTQF
jgi:leucine dehydrogenase